MINKNCKYYIFLQTPIYKDTKPIQDYCQLHCDNCNDIYDCKNKLLNKLTKLSQELGLYEEREE